MTSEKLRRHFETYYTPERTVISVCGSFNKDEILEVIDKYYSGIKYGGNPPVFSPAVYHPGIRTVKKPYSQNQMIVGFEGLKINDGNRYTAHLLSTILCNSNSSMLFQRLREKLGIVYEVTAEHINYMEAGAFAIFTAHSKEDEETVIREILDITDNFSRRVTDRELAIAKELVISNFVMGLEDIPDSCSVNGKQIMFTGNLRNIDEDIQKFSDVTAAQIKEFADGLFDRSRISLCVAGRTQSRKLYKDILGGV